MTHVSHPGHRRTSCTTVHFQDQVQISKAMHLYEAGVPLPYIRDILGHVDLSTTEIYARSSTEAKRKALEAAYQDIVTSDLPEWNQDPGLLDWLASL